MASPVTDPELLARLKAKQNPVLDLFGNAPAAGGFTETLQNPPAKRKPVTDTALVQRLDQKRMAPSDTPKTGAESTLVGKGLAAVGNLDIPRGIHEGLSNRGLGVIQTGYGVMKSLGLIDENPEFEAAIQKAHAKNESDAKGSGVGGAVGEVIGDPINWLGGGGAAAERQLASQVGLAAAKRAGAAGAGTGAIKTAVRTAVTRQLAKDGAKLGAKIGAASALTGVQKDTDLRTRLRSGVKGTAQGAALGVAVPYGASVVGKVGRGVNTAATDIIAAGRSGTGRTPEQLDDALLKLKEQGDDLFNAMRQNNVDLTPHGGGALAREGQAAFKADRLDAGRHPVTTEVLRDLVDQVKNGVPDAVNPAKRTPFDVVAFDMLRRRLGDALGEDGAQAGKLRAAMFNAIQQPGALNGSPAALDNLTMALQQWQKASRFEDVAGLAKKANNDPNRIRNAVNTFTDKSKNTKNLLPDELEALTRAGTRTIGDKALSLVGGIGVDMGSISRNPRAVVPYLLATGKIGGSAAVPGAAVPVAVGTVANSVRNRIANGKLEKALRAIEERQISAPTRPPAAPVVAPTPQITGPTAPLALPSPPTIMVPAGNGAVRAATPEERAAMYAQRGQTPELEASQFGAPRAPSAVQQQANDSVRAQMQQMSLTPDVLRTQRSNQITAAEAEKAIQDAAAQQASTQQLAGSQPPVSIGDMLAQSQAAAADRAAAVGEPAPGLSAIGQALAKALQEQQAPAAAGPLKLTIRPHPQKPVDLPQVDLPGPWE